jgi:BirA family biotin operon repressor/biotin-[acetyl-CoA-carboxylase] ligase
MKTRDELVRVLADGAVHSGADLARELQCSRANVWKQIHQLEALGLEMTAIPGRGYRLEKPFEWLDPDRIRRDLAGSIDHVLVEVFSVIDSTNDHLHEKPLPEAGEMQAVLAEYQTGGRGRNGRKWLSPFGSGLCLSVSWLFPVMPPSLPALSLAAGVAVNRALAGVNPAGLGLKWPNDIVAAGGKLGGLLVDVQGESGGPIRVIVGVGINIDLPPRLSGELSGADGLPPVGLRQLTPDNEVSRNAMAAEIIGKLHAMLREFSESGFAGFVDEWRAYDCMQGKQVTVHIGQRAHTGRATGISEDGALLLDEQGEIRRVVSGEVTLRPA